MLPWVPKIVVVDLSVGVVCFGGVVPGVGVGVGVGVEGWDGDTWIMGLSGHFIRESI